MTELTQLYLRTEKSRVSGQFKKFLILGVMIAILFGGIAAQSCTVEGCDSCKAGFNDRCDKCASGYDDRFENKGGVPIKTCLKVTSTATILAIVLPICGCVLILALIFLFWWIHIKRLIARNIELYHQRRDELVRKRKEYEERRRQLEPEYIEYMRRQSTYEEEMKKLKELRDRLDRAEQQEYENRMRALQPPPPPQDFNIFVQMEQEFLQKQAVMQQSTSLRLPPGFLEANPAPPPIVPLAMNFSPQTFTTAGYAPTGGSNQIYPPPAPYHPIYKN